MATIPQRMTVAQIVRLVNHYEAGKTNSELAQTRMETLEHLLRDLGLCSGDGYQVDLSNLVPVIRGLALNLLEHQAANEALLERVEYLEHRNPNDNQPAALATHNPPPYTPNT